MEYHKCHRQKQNDNTYEHDKSFPNQPILPSKNHIWKMNSNSGFFHPPFHHKPNHKRCKDYTFTGLQIAEPRLGKVTLYAVAHKQVSQSTSITIHHRHHWPRSAHLPYFIPVIENIMINTIKLNQFRRLLDIHMNIYHVCVWRTLHSILWLNNL